MYGTKEQALVYTLTLSFNARHVMVGTTPGKNPNTPSPIADGSGLCLVEGYGGNGYPAHSRPRCWVDILLSILSHHYDYQDGGGRRIQSNDHARTRKKTQDELE